MHSPIATALAAASFGLLALGPATADWQPNRPVEFIVASGPGGGTDQFARLVQSIIQKHELMTVPVIVSNKGGGAGSEAFVYGKGAAGDPNKVVFGTNNEWLLPLVTKMGYQSSDLRPVGSMAVDEFILWTNTEAPYKTAAEFIESARQQNGGMKVAGSQSKDTDQILVRRLEKAAGVKFTYVPFKSGGEAAVQLAGAHVEANTNNPQENVGQWKAGKVRPLCVFSPKRLSYKETVVDGMSWADIPTCVEAGIPLESYQMPRTVWLPKGTSDEQVAFYAGVLDKVRQTPEWKEWLERTSQSESYVTGAAFAEIIKQDEAKNRVQFAEDGWLVN
ncbi:MAG TPA: tripartite tricarboxylate transporter substrate binding protein [Xanthobacteraceae bacterium]|nr:tripartite tricarboxylate transporter substrate binding protein [Xanthobacteraceae bacterium]